MDYTFRIDDTDETDDRRQETGGVQTPTGPPVAYGPSPLHLLNGEIEIDAMTEFEMRFKAQWDQEEPIETTLRSKTCSA